MAYNPKALTVAQGGTGSITLTAYNLVVGNGASAPALVAPSATSGIPLVSGGSSANPSYTTAVVAGGGTGVASTTAYAVLCGGTTSTGALQSIAGVGTSGQVLTSNGAGALPTFQAAGGGGSSTYFSAALTNNAYANSTGDGTQINAVIFDTVNRNTGSAYNNSTGVFTAPSNDFYFFNAVLLFSNINPALNLVFNMFIYSSIFIARVEVSAANMAAASDSGRLIYSMGGGYYLTAGTQVQVGLNVTGSSKTVNVVGQSDNTCNFCGFSLH